LDIQENIILSFNQKFMAYI